MQFRPALLGLSLVLAACQSAPVASAPTVVQNPAAQKAPTPPPGATLSILPGAAATTDLSASAATDLSATTTIVPGATAAMAPIRALAPSALPSATSVASATPSLSPLSSASTSPVPNGAPLPLGEANHGQASFPSAPGSTSDNIPVMSASALAGPDSARVAIDGRLYTEWSARQPVSDPVVLTLDLGATRTFSRVDLLPDASPDVNCFFNVDVSVDNLQWTTVGTGNAFGSNNLPIWGTAQFDPQTARYIRIKPTSWGTSWVAVWEVRVRK